MFVLFVLCIFLYSAVPGCAATRHSGFRSDYTYSKEAGGWLKLHKWPANWRDARLRCQLEGARLASPTNQKLLSTMTHMMDQYNSGYIYTGVHATFSKGDYTTLEGVPVTQIQLRNDGKSCTAMTHGKGHLFDVDCNNMFRFICFKKDDHQILTQNDCGTVDDEYQLSTATGSCYKFHRTPRTWSRAYMACSSEGGYLAIINSQKEAEVISGIFNAVPKKDITIVRNQILAHIGFHDWSEHGSWLTIHGQTLKEAGYDTWHAGEPNNVTGAHTGWAGESCGSIYQDGQLNDLWCDYVIGFFCEKDPKTLAVKPLEEKLTPTTETSLPINPSK